MHPPSCAPSCSLCKAPEPKYDLTPASRDDAGQANRQPASGVLLIPWRAGTSSLRVAASGYRCTASAVTQIQGVARKARALGLPPMAKPTAVKATNTMGMAAPWNQAQPRRPSKANHPAITRVAAMRTTEPAPREAFWTRLTPAAPGSVASLSPSCLLRSTTLPDRLRVSSCWPVGGGLEEFDHVAGGVLEQDLLAAGSCEDVVAEPSTRVAEAGDFDIDVVDDEVDSVPAAGYRLGAIRHWPPRGAGRPAEQQPQVAARDVGESGNEARQNLEVEKLRVEGDGALDVIDDVANIHHFTGVDHGFSLAEGARVRWVSTASR